MRNAIVFIIGLVGFMMCLNEQPPGEVQNWWINGVGLVLFGGAAALGRRWNL